VVTLSYQEWCEEQMKRPEIRAEYERQERQAERRRKWRRWRKWKR